MRNIITIIITLLSFAAFGQQMDTKEWSEQAKTNKRLLPKYGNLPKNDAEKKADAEFIKAILSKDSTNRRGSDHLISLGFDYLYKDIKTAMYRFNQAYLLDSTNEDIYWGYGCVYMILKDYEKAKQQYLTGLSVNPENTHLLTDYGTYFLTEYYGLIADDKKDAMINLDSAIYFMTKSYQLDTANQNTSYKLSICYLNKKDCINALKYYDICKKLGGQPIRENYIRDLEEQCNPKK